MISGFSRHCFLFSILLRSNLATAALIWHCDPHFFLFRCFIFLFPSHIRFLPYPQYHHVCYQLSFASSACTANPYAIDCIIDGMLLTLISSCTSWSQVKSTNPLLLLLPITSIAMSIAISTHGYSQLPTLDWEFSRNAGPALVFGCSYHHGFCVRFWTANMIPIHYNSTASFWYPTSPSGQINDYVVCQAICPSYDDIIIRCLYTWYVIVTLATTSHNVGLDYPRLWRYLKT